jgi:hypothetical protein
MLLGAVLGVLAATPSTAVGVGLSEFHVAAYRHSVPPGVVRLNTRNLGEDPHDLAIRDAHGKVLATLPRLAPGGQAVLKVRLRKVGTYRLFCTIADHEQRGMRTKLRVRR